MVLQSKILFHIIPSFEICPATQKKLITFPAIKMFRGNAPLLYALYAPFEWTTDLYERRTRNWIKKKKRVQKTREEENVTGKVVVITGANCGLGKHTAIAMAKRGAVVVMGCRDLERGEQARQEIMETSESKTVELFKLDLCDLETVRKFASDVVQKHPVIDILINNAGISLNDRVQQKTKEGWDLMMTTNHLGHFLLTNLLIDAVSASEIRRVVSVSSTGLISSKLETSDFMMEHCTDLGMFNGVGYSNSKLAMSLCTRLLGQRHPSVKTYSLCPGFFESEIFRYYEMTPSVRFLKPFFLTFYLQKVEFGVDGVLLCAVAKKTEKDAGGFFRFGKRVKRIEKIVGNDKLAEEVWAASEKFCGEIRPVK